MAKRKKRPYGRKGPDGVVQTLKARRDQVRREQLSAEREHAAELARFGLDMDVEQATRDGMDAHLQKRFADAVAADDADLFKRAVESDGAGLTRAEELRVGNQVWNAKPVSSEAMVDQIERVVDGFKVPEQHIVSQNPVYQDFRTIMDEAVGDLDAGEKIRGLPGNDDGKLRALVEPFMAKMEPYAKMLTDELESATMRVASSVKESTDDDATESIVIHGPSEELRVDGGNMVLGYLGFEAKERFDRALDEAEAAGDLSEDGMRRRVRGDALAILRATFNEATRVRDHAVEEILRLQSEIAELEGDIARSYDPIRDFRRDEREAQRAIAAYVAALAARAITKGETE